MRQAGILLAVSSLPGKHGIGDFIQVAALLFVKASKTGFNYGKSYLLTRLVTVIRLINHLARNHLMKFILVSNF